MRSDATAYDLIAPRTLHAVLAAMRDEERTPIAGGTEVMVALCAGRLQAKRLVSLQHLRELRGIDSNDAATLCHRRCDHLYRSAALQRHCNRVSASGADGELDGKRCEPEPGERWAATSRMHRPRRTTHRRCWPTTRSWSW